MTLEENFKLRDKLEELGYIIKIYPENNGWSAIIPNYIEDGWRKNVDIVDSSYSNMDYINYKIGISGPYIKRIKMRPMEDCTVEEILNVVGEAKLQVKMMKERERLKKLERDFK